MQFIEKLIAKIVAFLEKLFGKLAKDESPAPVPTVAPAAGVAIPPPRDPVPPELPPREWPPGTTEFVPGAFYVPYRGSSGGPFAVPAEAYAWMARIDQWFANTTDPAIQNSWRKDGTGSIPVGELSDNDCAYLAGEREAYQHVKHNGDLSRDVLSGSHDDINRSINTGDRINYSRGPWGVVDHPQLRQAVQQAFAVAKS